MLPEINNRIYPALDTISTGIYATAQVIRSWFWGEKSDLVTVSFCVEDGVSLNLSEIIEGCDNGAMEEVFFSDEPLDFRAGVTEEVLSRSASFGEIRFDLPDENAGESAGLCGVQVSNGEVDYDDEVVIELYSAR